jgi:BirA family biotin operon repressor/biotin-[acetyl-CoA-carboxylase] ligase
MPALPPAYRLFAHTRVTSTNDVARELIAAGMVAGSVVWAESQSAGRGRQGRRWESPPGNLYASIVLRPLVDQARLPEISLVAALAVRDALVASLPADIAVTLKWPNDVLADGRKIAGILSEVETLPGRSSTALILGIGVNILSAPVEADYPATNLAAFAPPPKSSVLLGTLVGALDRRLESWSAEGFAAVRDAWTRHAHGIGARIGTSTGVTGAFCGLDETGAIVIGLPDGGRHRLVSGSIRYL